MISKQVDIEGAGAVWKQGTGGVICAGNEGAEDAARRSRVLRLVGLVRVGMAAEGPEGVKIPNSTEASLSEGER